ncbi:carbon-nitrogen hydrolase family protein [Vibrio ponticus]|uniref:Carbon-nitrogen hydrolase family protein n=1 Tax=Vibrio ponticus TaxID=265668 RepID=A0A3N3DVD2_9VIBR|nr:carbon-nitrogen hydrolase family protein [Vibrio ponticus]ROV58346.1 carbon-nitrogen hydrolase family protein [Vibrio ponticus]
MNTNNLSVALAQIPVIDGDVEANFRQHIRAAKTAAEQGADLVLFPELSLTGYVLPMAAELCFDAKHSILRDLSELAVTQQITIVAGCFLKQAKKKPSISAVICKPTGELDYYAKQYLHSGENEYCSAGQHNYTLRLKGYKLALAICADFTQPIHSSEAAEDEADVYLVSALVSPNGYEADAELLARIAKKHRFPVLLANHISETGGWQTAGNNAVWSGKGNLRFATETTDPVLGMVEITGNRISGHLYPLES